jgi:hypothetical protein
MSRMKILGYLVHDLSDDQALAAAVTLNTAVVEFTERPESAANRLACDLAKGIMGMSHLSRGSHRARR